NDVRAILKANCFHCHGEQGHKEGGLDLRLRKRMIQGGDSGASLVPGNSSESLLMQRIDDGEMPPPEIKKRLTKEEIATIRNWINQGAKLAGPEPEHVGDGPFFTEQEKN